MLKLIYGISGSGKTYLSDTLILKALADGKNVTLLVPEQEAIEAERRIADRADSDGILCENLTVVSFRRLADLAFRKYGGIEYKNISDGGKMLILWRIVEELAPALHTYKNNRDRTLIERLFSVCNELKRYCITASMLSRLADKTEDEALKAKLSDIALIYSAYTSQITYEYSDPTDDVTRLSEILKEKPMLKDSLLFLDSFHGFTVPELRCLEFAMMQCDVTITLSLPDVKGKTGYCTVEKTENALLDMAKRHNIPYDKSTRLTPISEYSPKEFRLIQDKLFDFSFSSEKTLPSERITFAKCRDAFSQAEFIAINICKLVRSGARYRDIAVINRNPESYDGVLDVIFEKYGIPLFFSKRSKLTDTAIYRTVIGALDVIQNNFRTENVMTYIKYGLCGVSPLEIDLLESYTATWGLTETRWTDEFDWNMNPSGFTDIITESGAEQLKLINEIRRRVCEPILRLKEDISSTNLENGCKAIYKFMQTCGIYAFCADSKDPADVTAYNTFVSLLDNCVTAVGDLPIDSRVLSSVLYLSAKNTDFGRIPATFDRVTAGDASILRVNGCKHVFLTDCENGVFPKAATDDSFFTEVEKSILSRNGIELSPDLSEQNDAEMFYFLSACGASETLTATFCLSDGDAHPSIGFTRLCSLFPANEVIEYPKAYSAIDKIQTISASYEAALASKGSPLFDVMKRIYEENGQPFDVSSQKIAEQINVISSESAESVFGKQINLTHSRIENYVKCPFSYYCNYVLKLGEKKHSYFRASDMGTYIHRILELVVSILYGEEFKNKEITDKDVLEITERTVNSVLRDIIGEQNFENMRLKALTDRLKKTVLLLIRNIVAEFKNSSFAPKYFEFRIGRGQSGVEALNFVLPDGTNINVSGVIDRVDSYEKDGKIYVRVVDYKTGTHEHSLDNIALGIDMQMFLYLFAICKSGNTALFSDDGEGKKELLPAGVLYQPSRLKITKTQCRSSEEDALSFTEKTLLRSGVLLNDDSILKAMDHRLEARYIPVKDGAPISKDVALKTLDEFGGILNTIEDTIKEIGEKMKSGQASASPMKNKIADACKYCSMYPVCRSKIQ